MVILYRGYPSIARIVKPVCMECRHPCLRFASILPAFYSGARSLTLDRC